MNTKPKTRKSPAAKSKRAAKPRTRRATTSKRSKSPIREGIDKILSVIGLDSSHSRSRS